DGLLKYTSDVRICGVAREADLLQAAHSMVELVRLPSGGLQDDVAVVLCRRTVDVGGACELLQLGREWAPFLADALALETSSVTFDVRFARSGDFLAEVRRSA